ncbi:hypothetical protein AB0P17_24570 [Streptomyces sp. NPDC088124]|uniref:hypothetical protein n=1 Tax=Streptomyces sp. NPDC088124 TaxID=3154654 RepID=UPI00343A45EC
MIYQTYEACIADDLLRRVRNLREDADNLSRSRGAHYDEVFGRGMRENVDALRELVENGWPCEAVFGPAVARAALLLAVVSVSPDLQEHCLQLVRRSVQLGQSPAEHLQVLETVCCLNQPGQILGSRDPAHANGFAPQPQSAWARTAS